MMILTKTIFVKITGTQIKYYNDLGYKCKALDIIEIKVEDLSKGSINSSKGKLNESEFLFNV